MNSGYLLVYVMSGTSIDTVFLEGHADHFPLRHCSFTVFSVSSPLFQHPRFLVMHNDGCIVTRPDTRHKMLLVCVLFTFENNTGQTDGPTDRPTDLRTYGLTDGRTRPHIEMRRRI